MSTLKHQWMNNYGTHEHRFAPRQATTNLEINSPSALGHCNCAVPTCPSCGQTNLGRTSDGGFSTTEVLIIAFVVMPVLGWALGQ